MTMRSIVQDFRYALRQFRRAPGFSITVVAVLALGIGANIAVFTVLNGVLIRPLPYEHPDRVVAVELSGPLPYYSMSYANMLQLRDAAGPQVKIGGEIYGVQVHDGVTFAAVTAVLALAAFLAAWLPARRAAAVDPILALRSE